MNLFRLITRGSILRNLRSFSAASSPRVAPRVFPTTGFTILPASEKLDEENLLWYEPDLFYPVNIGEVLRSRYQVLYKLGYGTTLTVWMCRDLDHNTYVCVKSVCHKDLDSSVQREIKAHELMSQKAGSTSAQHGEHFRNIRQLLDNFQLRHGDFDYHFLVQEPLGIGINQFLEITGHFPLDVVQAFAANFLKTLAFVHSAGIIHADIHSGNFFNRIQDEALLQELEDDEIANPSPRKIMEHSTIFATKEIKYAGSLRRWFGNKSALVLCDFGEARMGKRIYTEPIQPPAYRAPEVSMRIGWDQTADIWSLGCMLWHFATGEILFPCNDRGPVDPPEERRKAYGAQLTTIAALLGPPPPKLLTYISDGAPRYFNDDGTPKYVVPEQTLESHFASAIAKGSIFPMPAPKEAADFIAFIRRVLIWEFLVRPNAWELLKDPWIVAATDLEQ